MQREMKMQADMQVNVNVPVYKRQAKSTERTKDFAELLQGKTQQLKPKQETGEKTPETVDTIKQHPKKDGEETETSEAKTDSVNADETVQPEDTKEEALLQAAMQQTAALMAGILPDNQEELISQVPEAGIEELTGVNEKPEGTENQEAAGLGNKFEETIWQTDLGEAESKQIQEIHLNTGNEKLEQAADEVSREDGFELQMKGRQEEIAGPQKNGAETASSQEIQKSESFKEQGQQNPDQNQTAFFDSSKSEEKGRILRRQEPAAGNEKVTSMMEALQQRGEAQAPSEGVNTFHHMREEGLFGHRTESSVPLKTTPDTLPQDLGKTLSKSMMESGRTLTVELEPASLGKLTIRMIYDGGRAAVSIMATNPKTQEILNQKASEIAAILEEKTGQETLIYTQQPESNQEGYDREPDSQRNEEGQKDKKQNQEGQQADSFAQQLRLGLV
ncbi:MAG: hypothetical protein HFG49_09790 [Lachnospiraceae bacterium]|nr:hypothetical protein [Lachnospiraceae bacterium]